MIALLVEIWREIITKNNYLTLYLLIAFYFWFNWLVKWVYSLFYKPVKEGYSDPVSVVMPAYHEDREVLFEAIRRLFTQPANVVGEVIVVTDAREPDLKDWVTENFGSEARLSVIETQNPGKRYSLRLGIEKAIYPVVVSVESDVFVRQDSITELIKPFADEKVGGVVGDQEVHDPHRSLWTWFDYLAEKVKYALLYPALGSRNLVAVLPGRTVAYRKSAVMPLLDGLTNEYFLRKKCVAGDDGRLTSLLLSAGWKTAYQSTSIIETVSPSTMKGLFRQRRRWFRNTARRTLRAIFGFGEGFWVYRKPLVLWNMLIAWTNSIMIVMMLIALYQSITGGYFYWFGTQDWAILLRWLALFLGLPIARFIRSLPGLNKMNWNDWRMLLLLVYPWYLFGLWIVRLSAIATMNKQGWVTRSEPGAGGFARQSNGQ